MKKLLFAIAALLTTTMGFAQNFDIAFGASLMGENYSLTPSSEAKKDADYSPKYQLTFSNIFNNNFEIGAGIAYYNYRLHVKKELITEKEHFLRGFGYGSWQALSIPVFVGYKLDFGEHWYAKINTGLSLDFYKHFNKLDNEVHYWSDGTFYTASLVKQDFNVLLSNSISIYYITKFNMFIGAHASYYTGLRQVWESNAVFDSHVPNYEDQDFDVWVTSKGSYFQFGLTVGYRFNKK